MFGWFKKNVPPRTGPDFRPVDSLAKAQELVRAGQLQKMFLLPAEFGDEDIPPNCTRLSVDVGRRAGKYDLDVGQRGCVEPC